MQGAIGPFFFGIGEGAQAFETRFPDEIEQVAEFGFALAGMADDERGPQDDAGNQLAHLRHQFARLPAVDTAPHHRQHPVGAVLQRDVDIRTDLRIVRHDAQDVLGEAGGIAVVQADPLDAVDLGQLLQQPCQAAFPVAVKTVVSRILGDDDQLPHALGGQAAGFFHQILDGHAHMRAADERDGAVGTTPVAAFRDFQIGIMRRRGEDAAQGVERQHALPLVHLRDLGPEFLRVAL